MKFSKFLPILAFFLLMSSQAFAATVFVAWGNDSTPGQDATGQQGAEILTAWESQNTDKRIVSVTAYYSTGGDFRGFWVTYEAKEPKK